MRSLLLAAAVLATVVLQPGGATALNTPCGKVVLRALPAAPLPGAAPAGYVLSLQPPPGTGIEASVEAPPGAPPAPLVRRGGALETPYPLPYGSDAVLVLRCGHETLEVRLRVEAPQPPSPGAAAAPRTFTPPEPAAEYPFGISKAYREVFGGEAGHQQAPPSKGGAENTSSGVNGAGGAAAGEGGYRFIPLRAAAAVLLAASLAELLLSQRRHGHTYEA